MQTYFTEEQPEAQRLCHLRKATELLSDGAGTATKSVPRAWVEPPRSQHSLQEVNLRTLCALKNNRLSKSKASGCPC